DDSASRCSLPECSYSNGHFRPTQTPGADRCLPSAIASIMTLRLPHETLFRIRRKVDTFEERMVDMNSLHRKAVLTSVAIGLPVAGAACNQRTPSTTGQNMSTPPSTSSQSASPPQTAMAPTTPAATTSKQMSGAVDDAAITAQVKTAIMAEPGLKSTNIN